MKKLIILIFFIFLFPFKISADSAIDNGINYLKSQQNNNGKITNGFSSPSQWASIAFSINNIDISEIKNPTQSLKDFLLSDYPTNGSATDYETRILAIVAIGENPTNFGGQNYIQKLESFYSNNQIGDTCSLNDDIFGLLTLTASGSLSTTNIKQSVLDFIISKQDSSGGFGWSAPGCSFYETSSDMTAAALQALQLAKDNNFTNSNLDNAISSAKNYLLNNQYSDGGFGYYGSSDPDTTSWAMMALNTLGLKEASESARAKIYLLSKQSSIDGGFQSYDYSTSSFVSNSTTTSQALIALSGKSWVFKIFSTEATSSATLTATPSATISPNPTPKASSSVSSSISTPSPTPTLSPIPTPSPFATTTISKSEDAPSEEPTSKPEVLGENSQSLVTQKNINPKKIFLSIFSLANFLGAAFIYKFKI